MTEKYIPMKIDDWFMNFSDSLEDKDLMALLDNERAEKINSSLTKLYKELDIELGVNVFKIYYFLIFSHILQEARFRIMYYHQQASLKNEVGTNDFIKEFRDLFDKNFQKDMSFIIDLAKSFEPQKK